MSLSSIQLQTAPPWRALGASVRGTSHAADGRPCQDAHQLGVVSDILIAAVADGAGSASRSDEGSQKVVASLVQTLSTALVSSVPSDDMAWRELLRCAFGKAKEALSQAATTDSISVQDLAATALVAILSPDTLAVAAVGDCTVICHHQAQGWVLPIGLTRGEYANETTFITSPAWENAWQTGLVRPAPGAFALFSDGLLRLAMNLGTSIAHAPFFDPLLNYFRCQPPEAAADALRKFLDSERVNARTDDDKTLILAWRDEPDLPLG